MPEPALSAADHALIEAATTARTQAYAPYSEFNVGSAYMLPNGSIQVGANIENASYGLAICAERNAIAAGVMKGLKPGDLKAIAVVTDAPGNTMPCGACRQVIFEFGAANTRVLSHNLADKSTNVVSLEELLPYAFGPQDLKK